MGPSRGLGRAVVLGAGIQGVSAALALRRAGWSVELLDRAPVPLTGASLHGEGKLHLGFVYANEPSRRTAATVLEGALAFGDLLDRWLPEPVDWAAARSEPFWYAVPEDSLRSVDELAEHYDWVAGRARDHLAAGGTYAGTRPDRWVAPATPADLPGVRRPLLGAFRTAEVAVDPRRLRTAFVAGLEALGVPFHGGTLVEGVERTASGLRVKADTGGGGAAYDADLVVNCLWDGRLAVDATMGLVPDRPWVFRLKQYVQGRLPAGCPPPGSITFVLGPYGDTVVRSDGRVYGSWYPECLIGWTSEIEPPPTWRPFMDGTLTAEESAANVERILAAFAEVVPALAHLLVEELGAGVIFAWGDRDIGDPTSDLHQRADIGVELVDGYATINTGKLTTAPLFADRLVAML